MINFYIFVQLTPNKNINFGKWFRFVRCLMPSLACITLFPLDLGYPLHMLCIYVMTFHCQKAILGRRRRAS